MARIVLVTGGTRSGKSSYAQDRAEALPGRRCFLATCQVSDEEMKQRVAKHQAQRDHENWDTIEEPLDIGSCVEKENQYDVFLIDCLTLWIANVMDDRKKNGKDNSESAFSAAVRNLLRQLQHADATVFVVTNEVGLGIVPENSAARRFRDLVGLCNQIIASQADEVVLLCCGLPLYLKN